jgi:2-polyprenyl-3-methyl-5-hydroxy-6-metoxy-1,4-benzoquinol methylase
VDTTNARTLAAYEEHVTEYLAADSPDLSPYVTEWLDVVVSPYTQARILEIGSGPGTIADHLISLGHQVDLTDATQAFIENLRARGHHAQNFNVLTDPVPEGYDVILANAVFLHLTHEQFVDTLHRLLSRLSGGGRLAFTLKQGDGEEWSTAKLGTPRYFCYWQPEPLRAALVATGFGTVRITRWTAPSGQKWLAAIADSYLE